MTAYPTYCFLAAKSLILCAVFIFAAADASPAVSRTDAPADTLVISMEQFKGFGPFQATSAFLRERDRENLWHPAEPEVRGTPDGLTDFFYQVEMMDFVQHAWQSCLAGLIDCDMVRDAFRSRDIDTTRLTDTFLDTYVTVGTGIGDDGQRKVIIHSGGARRGPDGRAIIDLSGIELFPLPDPETGDPRRDRETMVVRPVQFELFNGEEIIRINDWYRISGPVPFGSLEDDRVTLVIGTYSHREGKLILSDREFHFYMNNRFTAGMFHPETTYLYAGQHRDGIWLKEDQLIQLGEVVCLGNKPYRFDWVSADGSEIRLVHEPDLVHQAGTDPGHHVPELEATTFNSLNEGHVSLCALRGSWVYVNFWGTWCTSCVEDLPFLEEAWRIFGGTGDFHMIGVAYDSESAVKTFLEDRDIGWPQILETFGSDNPILTAWDIRGFPSTFFIDRNGMIQKRQLSRYDLERELAREIGFDGPAGERFLSGSIVFSRAFPDAQGVTIESGFSLPGRTPLYQIDGKWRRGFSAGPGEHRYRLYVDGNFTPDPENPRIEEVDGRLYNIITVAP